MNPTFTFTLVAALTFTLPASALARKQVETEHYVVVFEPGQEYWAHKVIEVAEEVWDNLVTAYELQDEYKKVYIYVEDEGDHAQGYTLPSRNRVTVGTTALEMGIRSSDNWVRNVVTHELAHVFSIKAANKDGFFKNWSIGRTSAYQNPNITAVFHYRDLLAPQWWIEGVAQYEAYKNGNDRWDTHRDMFLRMAVLEDDLLDEAEIATFDSRNGFYPEMTYNQGFSMMLYIDSVFGEDAARNIAQHKSFFHFSHSLRRATGLNQHQLYRQWKEWVKARYAAAAVQVGDVREGRLLYDGGFWDDFPAYAPDGKRVALVSNRGYDVIYPHLYVLNTESGEIERIRMVGTTRLSKVHGGYGYAYAPGKMPVARRLQIPAFGGDLSADAGNRPGPDHGPSPTVFSRVGWLPDGSGMCYARNTEGSTFRDVYLYDFKSRRECRVTWQARARDPAVSPDGKAIAYVQNDGGTNNLALARLDGGRPRKLTNFNNDCQLYSPCWSPDGKKIFVGILQGQNRDIAVVNADAVPFDRLMAINDTSFFPDSLSYQDDLGFLLVVHTAADERDPCLSPDGKFLYFSSDRTGIFNIYRMNLETWQVEQVTNVIGGAFSPSVSPDGRRLVYTGYHAANYSIYEIPIGAPRPVKLTYQTRDYRRRFDMKKLLFAADPRSGQYRLAEYRPRLTLWRFQPYLSWQPAYITDSIGVSQMRFGAAMIAGELRGNLSMGSSVYVSKDFDNRAGPSWGADLVAALKAPELFGENRDFKLDAYVFGARDVIRGEDTVEPSSPEDVSFWQSPHAVLDFVVDGVGGAPDTLVGRFVDDYAGFYRDQRTFSEYGFSAGITFNRRNRLGAFYARSIDRLSARLEDYQWRRSAYVLTIPGAEFNSVRNITNAPGPAMDVWRDSLIAPYDSLAKPTDYPDLYANFNVYNDHRIGFAYQFANIGPGFTAPPRVDYLALGVQLVRSGLTVAGYGGGGTDTLLERDRGSDVFVKFGADGVQVPQYRAVEDANDYVVMEAALYERFPLPGNRSMNRARRPWRSGHYLSLGAFVGSLSRRLPPDVYVHPLEYRYAQFLKGYPYSFDPFDPVVDTGSFVVERYSAEGRPMGVTAIRYEKVRDGSQGDIMAGNGIAYYFLEYTLELLRGVSIAGAGSLIERLAVTPFVETAAVWNRDWRDVDPAQLAPVTGRFQWRDSFLRDWGIRTELTFLCGHTWHGALAFTWARRLDLDRELLAYERRGNRLTKTYLDKDRFSLTLHVW